MRVPLIGRGEGLYALVDEEDFATVSHIGWRVHTPPRSLTMYARGSVDGVQWLMHRFILKPQRQWPIDHRDGDGLNNRRLNLRVVTHRTNVVAGVARRAFDRYENDL
jgi:hypothetical protein